MTLKNLYYEPIRSFKTIYNNPSSILVYKDDLFYSVQLHLNPWYIDVCIY